MNSLTTAEAGRLAVLLAMLMQAAGKVAFGTMLTAIPSQLFVLISLTLTATLFLTFGRSGVGLQSWKALAVLNTSTAVAFLCFFFALKLIEPAIAVAVNIGVGPLLAVMIAWVFSGQRPTAHRLVVCAGIVAGCAVLCLSAFRGSGFAASGNEAWLGLAAAAAAGIGTALITISSKRLVEQGWKSGAILAHRFYLVIPISLFMSLGVDMDAVGWSTDVLVLLSAIAVIAVTVPLYLLQFGIRRCDPYTVTVTMTSLPILTFLVEGLSPAYEWSVLTAAGLAILTGFLLVDIGRARRGA